MAEVRERNSVLISTGGAMERRESMNSMLSNGSEQGARYLTVPAGQNNLEPSTPMCVRPFTPSESFAFPKPPAPRSSTTDSFFISRTEGAVSPRSSATLFMTDLPPPPVLAHSLHPQTSMPSVTPSPFIAAANPSIDPFADPLTPGFADVEVLSVRPDDRVRLLQIFDDGWVFVEKLGGTEGERHERGLIPVDCLHETSQALPTFLAKERVSYGSDQLIATAL
ncbi:hypothetical protein J3R83DRAFT_5625 [Lanmaoa asiatica]|nr:hypothetical protein J3R83DRAFT_5625 [Lanmaoa asiatica]